MATTTIFGVTYGVLMKPLPWPHSDRIVVLKETHGVSAPRFGDFTNAAQLAWREGATRARTSPPGPGSRSRVSIGKNRQDAAPP